MKIQKNYLVAIEISMVEFCIIEEKKEFICISEITMRAGEMA